MQQVEREIGRLREAILSKQDGDGSFRYEMQGSPLADACMIILLRSLELGEEALVAGLARHLLKTQEENGAWKLYRDEPGGNLSATVEAYYALKFAGVDPGQPAMTRACRFIREHGGTEAAGLMTQALLAATGRVPWTNPFHLPLELLLLPASFPVNVFEFSNYARLHMVPIQICADLKYALVVPGTPGLEELHAELPRRSPGLQPDWTPSREVRWLLETIADTVKRLAYLPGRRIHASALRRAEQFMLERIEPDGTLGSYFTATFLMVFALLAVGYPKDHPVVTKAVAGMKRLVWQEDGRFRQQMFTSTIWSTSLASAALQESGLSPEEPCIRKAGEYLLSRQQYQYGDWSLHNPGTEPGGWGFSDINTRIPDVDDTAAALRAIRPLAKRGGAFRQAWNRGLHWLLSMQNDDGGWAAFEKNTDSRLLTHLPVQNAEDALTDPSTADLTGHALELLGDAAGLPSTHPILARGIKWLLEHQKEDGCWYGRWGICHIYGTWSAVSGLTSAGVDPREPALARAAGWLESVQLPDGSFGESCASDIVKQFVALDSGTPSQTAWAVLALLQLHRKSVPAIERAVDALLRKDADRPDAEYPTGGALPGSFYLHYPEYNIVWPLMALCRYRNLVSG